MTASESGDLHPRVAAYRRALKKGEMNAEDVRLFDADRALAEAEFRRADKEGYALGSFQLGMLLRQRQDFRAAQAPSRRAVERADADGNADLALESLVSLAVVLMELGDKPGAEAAYRRGDEQYGDASSALLLGLNLRARGQLKEAEGAFRRAAKRGDMEAQEQLGGVLLQQGDKDGALAALRVLDERGDGKAAQIVGALLNERGDAAGAEAAYRRSDARGYAYGSTCLGIVLRKRGDLDGAEAAYRRAAEGGNEQGADSLRKLLAMRGGSSKSSSTTTAATAGGGCLIAMLSALMLVTALLRGGRSEALK